MTDRQATDTWPFPRDRANPLLPPPRIAELRAEGELAEIHMYDGVPAIVATSYDAVRTILMDPNISSDGRLDGFPYASDSTRASRGTRQTIDRLDSPEHDRQRAMLAPNFTQKRVQALRPFVEETVASLIDDLEASGTAADLVTRFAEPLPAIVISRLLALPLEDAPFFLDRIHTWTDDKADPAAITQAVADITEYFETLIDERASRPRDTDIISGLVHDQLETGGLSRGQLLQTIHLLLTAGFDTTTNAIALGTLLLLRHPEAWADLVADVDGTLVDSAVEEILRYLSVVHGAHMRLARHDLPVGHRVIPAGMGIIAPQMAANHDPAHYPDPDDFDIRRDARDHVAFGVGLHQCLGQTLARVELRAVFTQLPKRLSGLALAVPFDDLAFRDSAMIYGVEELPVRW